MNASQIDLTQCDREPIHIPGSIQPHGAMLIADQTSLVVTHAAGNVEALTGRNDWQDKTIRELLGAEAVFEAERIIGGEGRSLPGRIILSMASGACDAQFHLSGRHLIVELEPRSSATPTNMLPLLEAAAAKFERASTLQQLFHSAAVEFRLLCGYDRVMIYRFLDDDAGVVVAEDAAVGQHSFLHHHFPATDIPRQARALYVRNLVRAIPDVAYVPAPLVPDWGEAEPLDMSNSILRSVSPVHLQYLKNMGVAASASISIVKDGALWGLVACHNSSALPLSADIRGACRALAGGLSRQIKAREETDAYRERVRLRTFEDDIIALLSREGSLNHAISNHLDEFMKMLSADGVVVLRGQDLVMGGRHPDEATMRALGSWLIERSSDAPFATDRLAEHYDLPHDKRPLAAGVLAVTISMNEPWIVIWLRAEQVEVVNWAGNPHKNVNLGPGGQLTPRASFDAWSETVRGRAQRWTVLEVEAAGRLRLAVMGIWQNRRIRDLNRELLQTIDEKELLIRQKEFLIGEVNHRVQNSLQLVSGFLMLQARSSDNPVLQAAIEEARRRLFAVSLVHRRLYRADQLEAIDAARYIEELLGDLVASIGPEWEPNLIKDLHPLMLPADRVVGLGLVLNELITNANKYAYGGDAGPLTVTLVADRNLFRLIVADSGAGRTSTRVGFGSRMMDALVGQLGGTLEFEDNYPGTKATLVAPIESKSGAKP